MSQNKIEKETFRTWYQLGCTWYQLGLILTGAWHQEIVKNAPGTG